MLLEFDLHYIPQKSLKGQPMSIFLADLPIEYIKEESFNFSNEEVLQVEEDMWTMFIDGAWNKKGFGVRHPFLVSRRRTST